MAATPRGCVMHSTNGDTPVGAHDREFAATLNWFANPASGASAHATVHHDGRIAFHDPDLLAAFRTGARFRPRRTWHDFENNDVMLGLELAKSRHAGQVSDAQLRTAAWFVRTAGRIYGFPTTPDRLPEHRATAPGRRAGKIDIGGNYSYERLARFL